MPEVRRPADAIEKQVELIKWWQSPIGQRYAQGWAESMNEANEHLRGTYERVPGDDKKLSVRPVFTPFDGEGLNKQLVDVLDTAATCYVRSYIVTRLWGFVKGFRNDEGLQQEDLPIDRGFVWLEQSAYVTDIHGRMISVRAVLWQMIEQVGVRVFWFSDSRDPLDEYSRDIRKDHQGVEPGIGLFHSDLWTWGSRIGARNFPEGQVADAVERSHAADPATAVRLSLEDMNGIEQFLFSLWEFMQDQLPTLGHPDRPAFKRLNRLGYPWNDVKIIEVRSFEQHSREPNPDPEDVQWSHRWRVRSHKRRWIDKNGELRETTVSSYVKGPESLPLIEKDSVFHVKR